MKNLEQLQPACGASKAHGQIGAFTKLRQSERWENLRVMDLSGLAVNGHWRHHGMAVSTLYPFGGPRPKIGAAVALKGNGAQPGPGSRAPWPRRLTRKIWSGKKIGGRRSYPDGLRRRRAIAGGG